MPCRARSDRWISGHANERLAACSRTISGYRAVGDVISQRSGIPVFDTFRASLRKPVQQLPGPLRIGLAYRRGRPRIGVESQCHQRGCAPPFRTTKTGTGPPEPPQPDHRGAREGGTIIPRTGDYRNRHESSDAAPVFPPMELGQIVGPHEPDEATFRIAPNQFFERVHGEARAQFALDRGDADRRPAGLPPRRKHPRGKRRHPGFRLQRIARRDHPPDFVEPQRLGREKADAAVPAMGWIEAAAEQADDRPAAIRVGLARKNRAQGRSCPVPRTSHL